MATYAELSAEDRAIVDNTINLIRSSAGEMARVWNHVAAIAADTNAVGLITGLDAAGEIPYVGGSLPGADGLTRTEVVAVYNLLDGIRSTNDTPANRAKMSKAAGINALLG